MARKILRRFYHSIHGRKNFREEKNIDFERTLDILEDLLTKNCQNGEIDYRGPIPEESFRKFIDTPEIYRHVSEKFKPRKLIPIGYGNYFEGCYEVYFESKTEVHYIEISNGVQTNRGKNAKNKEGLIKTPYKRAKLKFLIKNL